MKYILIAAVLALAACSANPLQADNSPTPEVQPYPDWVLAPPDNSAAACAKVIAGNLPQAKQVALAKVQAEIAFNRKTHVESSVTVNKQLLNNQTSTQITQQTKQNTADEISGYTTKDFKIVSVNDKDNYCILYGLP